MAALTTAWQKLKAYLDLLNHVMIFVVTIYVSYVCYGYGPSNSSLHVWLCTIGVSYNSLYSLYAFTRINYRSVPNTDGRRNSVPVLVLIMVSSAYAPNQHSPALDSTACWCRSFVGRLLGWICPATATFPWHSCGDRFDFDVFAWRFTAERIDRNVVAWDS